MSQSLSQPCTSTDPSTTSTQVTCPPLTYASHFVPVSSSSSPSSPYGKCMCMNMCVLNIKIWNLQHGERGREYVCDESKVTREKKASSKEVRVTFSHQ